MAEIGRYYLLLFLICLGFILPGLCRADAWESSGIPEATVPQEKSIFLGCSFKAETVFYVAQQKLYAQGNVTKLLAYLKAEMSEAEYTLNEGFMRWVGEWVDSHQFKTAHAYSANLFAECVANSYQHFQAKPSANANGFMQRFYEQLDSAEELLLPQDADSEVSA